MVSKMSLEASDGALALSKTSHDCGESQNASVKSTVEPVPLRTRLEVAPAAIESVPPVTFTPSKSVPRLPAVASLATSSHSKVPPASKARPLAAVRMPGDAPGASVPPDCVVIAPPTVPVPPRVPPLAMVTAPFAPDWSPSIRRRPPLTVVVPL